jgi:rod shape-determining protein MreD
MRWITYFILAYFALGIQTGLDGFVRVHGAAPNFVLLAAIFIALNAPRDAALLGCFILGALQDLTTRQALGLYALSYGLTAMLVFEAQHAVYRQHPITHISLALFGGILTGIILTIHGLIHPAAAAEMASGASAPLPAIRYAPMTLFLSAVYTAALAPFVIGPLQRLKQLFSFQPTRRKIRPY